MRGVCRLVVVVAALLALVLPAGASGAGGAGRVVAADALERALLVELNALRARHGLGPLRASGRLARAAEAHSRAMAGRGFFAHESADGSAFWQRVRRFYASRGFARWRVGENLLWSSPGIDAAGALRMWLNSPPHRKNLLAPHWREIGLAAVTASTAPGVYAGRQTTILTADFGTRH